MSLDVAGLIYSKKSAMSYLNTSSPSAASTRRWSYALIGWLLLFCSCQSDTKLSGSGISETSWQPDETLTIEVGGSATVWFRAASRWIAQSSSTQHAILSRNTGEAGDSELTIEGLQSTEQAVIVSVQASSHTGKSTLRVRVVPASEGATAHATAADLAVNKEVDKYLRTMYLWNTEYKTLKPSFDLPYEDFLDETLSGMKTNTLDNKTYNVPGGKSYKRLYSYIRKIDPSIRTRAHAALIEKEKEYHYGLVGLSAVRLSINHTEVAFVVQGVHKGSSAEQAGLKRGSEIRQVNGQTLTQANWSTHWNHLLLPTADNTTTLKDKNGKLYTVRSTPIAPNPIIHHQVKQVGTHSIGYLAYTHFEGGFDQELFDVFKQFKQAHITDLIIDLRYNGGGHVSPALLMASCVAGATHQGKTFFSYRYNDDRMKTLGGVRPSENFVYSYHENLQSSLATGALNLPRVYFLVTNATASASELVIHGLRGLGISTVLIGKRTNGKNVGMEGKEIKTAYGTYLLFPVTFQIYNAAGQSDYDHGFAPSHDCDEMNPYRRGYEGLGQLGTEADPLYAKALSLITGQPVSIPRTRATTSSLYGAQPIPTPPHRPVGIVKP